jgi:hypothetical protein
MRILRGLVFSAAVALALPLVGCGDGKDAKHAKVVAGPMPEGETWTGVYFHPVYGYLHLVEEGTNIVGRWKTAHGDKWGELSGTFKGNVFHYQWREHTIGLIGAAATKKGKGYFVYKLDKEGRPTIEGQYGLDAEEVGSDWTSMKQPRLAPDLKSIGGDSEGVPPSSF